MSNCVRRSLPHVDLKYVLIRFKVLNDLSLEERVTGNVQSTSNNARVSGYRLVACGRACDGEVGRQAICHAGGFPGNQSPLDTPLIWLLRNMLPPVVVGLLRMLV